MFPAVEFDAASPVLVHELTHAFDFARAKVSDSASRVFTDVRRYHVDFI